MASPTSPARRPAPGAAAAAAGAEADAAAALAELALQRRGRTLEVAGAVDEFVAAFRAVCDADFRAALSERAHPAAFRAALAEVDLGAELSPEGAAAAFRAAYGWRAWLLAPEDGVRGVLRGTMLLHERPLMAALDAVHAATRAAAEATAARARVRTGPAGSAAARLEDEALRDLLLDRARGAVDAWRDATRAQLSRNLHAEAEFPAPERFAALRTRLAALTAAAAKRRAAETDALLRAQLLLSNPAAVVAPAPLAVKAVEEASTAEGTKGTEAAPEWSTHFMGWCDKLASDGRWQRRWVVLSALERRLYYFHMPEEQPARGAADLAGALVAADPAHGAAAVTVLLHPGGAAAAAAAGAPPLAGGRTKRRAAALTLRAATSEGARQWLAMLERAAVGGGAPAPPVKAKAAGADMGSAPGSPSAAPVGRKISTQVFGSVASPVAGTTSPPAAPAPAASPTRALEAADVAAARARVLAAAAADAAAARVALEAAGEEEGPAEEAARAAAEAALFEEVAAQAAAGPSAEEREVLAAVAEAVRAYVEGARPRLAEQAARVVADGMLPLAPARAEELRAALLRVLVGDA
jgi:hypothetical protein